MAKFQDIQKGTRARKPVVFPIESGPLLDTESPLGAESDHEAPDTVTVDLRVLHGEEEAECLRRAHTSAVKAGVAEPKSGDPLYDFELMIQTLAIACIDHESSNNDPQPFFSSADEIRKHLDRERIAYLFGQYEVWQDECSPQAAKISGDKLYEIILTAAKSEDPADPFVQLRPGTAAICFRTMAGLLLRLPELRSALGPSSTKSSTTASKSPPSSEQSRKPQPELDS